MGLTWFSFSLFFLGIYFSGLRLFYLFGCVQALHVQDISVCWLHCSGRSWFPAVIMIFFLPFSLSFLFYFLSIFWDFFLFFSFHGNPSSCCPGIRERSVRILLFTNDRPTASLFATCFLLFFPVVHVFPFQVSVLAECSLSVSFCLYVCLYRLIDFLCMYVSRVESI
ncbi:hypothetical protein VTN77DRAFT_8393 [Rasamsonia byssochlamydoides]|uniref:uncharacterized protein n=1 Tax=Rasamsonia byssochlamydoides TaxID=89139 RepID=UPI00374335B8